MEPCKQKPKQPLQEMLDMQKKFQKELGYDIEGMSIEERTAYIKEFSIHLNQEINEVLYELPFFKPWKDYSGMSEADKELAMAKARMEFSDAWHFMLNIALALSLTEDKIYELYRHKHNENKQRQVEGYTYDKKYR